MVVWLRAEAQAPRGSLACVPVWRGGADGLAPDSLMALASPPAAQHAGRREPHPQRGLMLLLRLDSRGC